MRTRWAALIILTGLNVLNYIDRYIFSALLPPIKRDLGFTDTQLGLLGSGFIFAYLLISPVFGYFGDRSSRPKLMASGVALWSAATAFSGVAVTFMGQMLTRITVGIGESAYSVIAPSVIADSFPKTWRGKVFAIYGGAIPIGSALGFILGGLLESRIGWQKSFFVVGVPGVILALLLLFLKDPERGQHDAEGLGFDLSHGVKAAYAKLFGNGGFLSTVMGYAAYTFVVGGMAFWMPMYIVRYFEGVSLEKGNLVFGGVTVAGGFVGTLLGGWLSDRIEKRSGNGFLKVSVWSMVFAIPLFIFALSMTDFTRFAIALFFMEIALFLCISPLDAAVINYVRPNLRATAMALNVFLIHALGDGISRALMGMISEASDLKTAILYLPWALVLAGIAWMYGVIFHFQTIPWPEGGLRIARLQSHRGYRPISSVQENTLEAFRLSKVEGAEMIELDVHLTADDQAVVFHDTDLVRIGGRKERVRELTAAQMHEMVSAPRLEEVLMDSDVPSLVNVELKTADIFGSQGLEAAAVRAIRKASAESRVVFSSFNPFALRRLSKIAPEIPRALLVSERPHPRNKLYLKRIFLGFWARPHLLHLDEEMITPERMEKWRDRGIPVVAWTVNDAKRALELEAMGVHSIISDVVIEPAKLDAANQSSPSNV